MLNFDEIFQTPVSNNYCPHDDKHLGAIFKSLNISRSKFSYRTRAYWNLLPKDIRHLTYSGFKIKAKEYVLKHSRKFLNLGNEDKEVNHKVLELNDYAPPKHAEKTLIEKTLIKKTLINEQIKALRRLHKNKKDAKTAVISDFGSVKANKHNKPHRDASENTKKKK